ncbi:MAG: GNAT family N-acetyltransferase [Clostridiales bacterium]|nr:GNAT family N-acetyltransferase [Clostridiales bacterium]
MDQLKMYRLPGTPLRRDPLPEGYSFSNYSCDGDKLAWAKCCRNGLISDDADAAEAFYESIGSCDDIIPEKDVFFLDHLGEHIGTVTAFVRSDSGAGNVHMVGMCTDYRGKGLSKYLSQKAVESLNERNVPYIRLTTDEWRKAAVKSYLSAGFLPVEYSFGMQDRWENVLEEYGIESVEMLYEDATPFRTIYRKSKSKKIRIGVVGAGRGQSMMDFCNKYGMAELVAICDNYPPALDRARRRNSDTVKYFDDFEEFLRCDMDAVILANYANEHAPFAVRCLKAGMNVLSEVLPVQSMSEAVELVETIEQTGKIYCYAENCCYMPSARKMREFYKKGLLGKFEYGEGEYMHNCESGWDSLTRGDPNHWRNTMSAFYYCTHSMGPMIHVSGLRPVRVSGFEAPFNDRMYRMGAKAGPFGVEIVTLENGALIKNLQGVGPSKDSTWFCVYGSKGRMESARVDDKAHNGVRTVYQNCDLNEGDNDSEAVEVDINDDVNEKFGQSGHGGADDYMMYHFIQKLRGNRNADVIDIYEALDMYLPGHFAYRSALAGGIPMDIPDLRNADERDKWRSDASCTDPAAGENALPSYSKGNPDIPDEVYDKLKEKFIASRIWES